MKAHCQLFTVSWLLPASLIFSACAGEAPSEPGEPPDLIAPGEPTDPVGRPDDVEAASTATSLVVTEAPTGFDGLTNGLLSQARYDKAKEAFEEVEEISGGLGPLFNAQSCRECHQTPVTGASSQITEFRAGHFNGTRFIDHPGGSLINDRAIDPSIQERVLDGQEVRAFRISLSLLGDGYVEAIHNNTFVAIANAQPSEQRGQVIRVPVLESPGQTRVGRFGWKNQQASLNSFAADAYLNEMGFTSPMQPTENTSNGNSVMAFDTVADPDDDGEDITFFTDFMRSLKAPPRDDALRATASAERGSQLFASIGCQTCHVQTIHTAPVGTVINGGAFTVPAALGDKAIHPFGDYLLHDIGTGDGIVQNGGQSTRNKVRTIPLWGLRTRVRLMHDGASVSRSDAIARHRKEAAQAARRFASLSSRAQDDVLTFLDSL